MPLERGDIDHLFSGMREIGELALEMMKDDFLSETAEEVPRKTHTLANSIQAAGGGGQWIIGTNLEYAGDVHEGTPPHVIEGNLYLWWPGAEHPVRRVNHPGYEGDPFFERTADTVEERGDNYVLHAIDELGLE